MPWEATIMTGASVKCNISDFDTSPISILQGHNYGRCNDNDNGRGNINDRCTDRGLGGTGRAGSGPGRRFLLVTFGD